MFLMCHSKTQTAMNTEDFKYHENKLNSILEELQLEQNATAEKLQHAASRVARKSAEAAACLVGMFNAIGQNNPLRYTNNGMRVFENDKILSFAESIKRVPNLPKRLFVSEELAWEVMAAYEQRKSVWDAESAQRLEREQHRAGLSRIARLTEDFCKNAKANESVSEYLERTGGVSELSDFWRNIVPDYGNVFIWPDSASHYGDFPSLESYDTLSFDAKGFLKEYLSEPAPIERKPQARKETIFEYESAKPELLESRRMKFPHFYGMGGNRFCVYLLHGSTWYIESQRLGKVIAFAFNGNAKLGRWNFPNDKKPVLLGGGSNAKATLGEVLNEATLYTQKVELN